MNCDEVFDRLTDPQHGAGPELEWHLSRCPRCRELREVLAPALSLFEGDDPPREPGFTARPSNDARSRPVLSPEAVQLAERTARELGLPVPARRPVRRGTAWATCAAGLLVGALLTSGAVWWTADRTPVPSHSAAPVVANACLWTAPKPPAPESPRSVILSCVACHLDGSLE